MVTSSDPHIANGMTQDRPKKLSSEWLLEQLAASGRISANQHARASHRVAASREHPVLAVAALELQDRQEQEKLLDAERILIWLAEIAEMPFYRIDPLKLNAAASAKALGYAYARKAGILVLRKGKDIATIAPERVYRIEIITEVGGVRKRVEAVYDMQFGRSQSAGKGAWLYYRED